uniref:Uncharacterized protein n=1 Tax=Arundo donax TaxID=35708 RepID=A0A0A9FHD6_ARUDO
MPHTRTSVQEAEICNLLKKKEGKQGTKYFNV